MSIPHQRNVGVREAKGDIIVFTDAGLPAAARAGSNAWWRRCRTDESVTAGVPRASRARSSTKSPLSGRARIRTCGRRRPSISPSAVEVFDAVGGFDESFAYGSDVDFSWRVNDLGYRIRYVPDAVIQHDYGTPRRQRRRSYVYGKARARLYRKHRARRKYVLRDDPIVVVYPLFLLGLPLTLIFPPYPLLLLVPAWRNRSQGIAQVLVDHLWFGAGVLAELAGR